MLTFGGDHFVSYPLLRAHAEYYGQPISLIHFDAHCDTWPEEHEWPQDPQQSPPPPRNDHGSMFYRAVKEGIVDPRRSVQIGLRTWNDDWMGFNVYDAPFVHQQGIERLLQEIRQLFARQSSAAPWPVYVTFDIDCLDPAFAPGTGTPVSGGLSSAQALQIIRSLASPQLIDAVHLVGADVVEVSPPFDVAEITALSAAHIALDLLCCFRAQKARGHWSKFHPTKK